MHGFREILCQLPDLLVDVEDRLSSLAKAGIREANDRADRHAIALRTQQVKIDVEFLIATAVPKHLDFLAVRVLPSKLAGSETAAGRPAEKTAALSPYLSKKPSPVCTEEGKFGRKKRRLPGSNISGTGLLRTCGVPPHLPPENQQSQSEP
jgi:hypothetical protein